MDLSDMNGAVYSALEGAFQTGTKVIKAFPFVDKPVRLDTTVIAVSPSYINLDSAGIGCEEQYGEVKITAAIYTPQHLGSAALLETAESAVNAVLPLMPRAVALSPIEAWDKLNCIACRCTFTFNCLIETEG